MTAVTMKFGGGQLLEERLRKMARNLQNAREVKVGFLADATYASDGGARLASAAKRAQKEGRTGWARLFASWAKWQAKNGGVFHIAQVAFWMEFGTRRSKPRPFFRRMIRSKSPRWGYWIARFLKASDFDAQRALSLLGQLISEQLQESIRSWPADNKPMTVFIKGFNHGLLDRSTMARHVDFQVLD